MSDLLAIPRSPDEPLLLHGDCLDVLARLPDKSVHVVIADPPAAIEFVGRHWDGHKGYEPRTPAGRAALRILTRLASSDATLRVLSKAVESAKVATKQAADGELRRTAKAVEKALARALKDAKAALVEEAGELVGYRGLAPREAGFVAFMVDVWTMVSRVLVPGGIVCAWALPKTSDLAGLALRLVFGEVHDSLLHLFGEGMPKAGDVGKQIDAMLGAERAVVGPNPYANRGSPRSEQGTRTIDTVERNADVTAPATPEAKRWHDWSAQLAPGWECWQIAINPTPHTLARQLLEHDTGAFNIGARRIPRGLADREAMRVPMARLSGSMHPGGAQGRTGDVYDPNPGGSWPRNVVITTGGEYCPAEEIDRQSGVLTNGGSNAASRATSAGRLTMGGGPTRAGTDRAGDSGGASRYFTRLRYTAKNSDRTMALRTGDLDDETRKRWATVRHPTVKSVELMRWLVGLLAAKAEHTSDGQPNVVLDCFMGSGPTGVACVHERVRFIGIERDPVGDDPNADQSFYEARARILGAIGSVELAAEVNATAPKGAQQVLF